MQLWTGLPDVGLHWCDMRFQKLDRVVAGIVEYEQALDFDGAQPLNCTLRVHCFDRTLQFLDKDQW